MQFDIKPKFSLGDTVFYLLNSKIAEMKVIESNSTVRVKYQVRKEPEIFENTVYTLAPTLETKLVSITAQKEEVFATRQELLDSL